MQYFGNRYETFCLHKSIKQLAKGGLYRESGANRLSAPRYQLAERYVGFGKMIEKEKIVQTTRKKFGYGVLWVVRPQRERPRPAHYTIDYLGLSIVKLYKKKEEDFNLLPFQHLLFQQIAQ